MAQTPVVIEQRINAGQQFNESLPSTTPVDAMAIRKFPVSNQGGLFDFDFTGPDASFVTYQIDQVFVDFGDAAPGEVSIINSDAIPKRVVLASLPAGGTFLRVDPIMLAWDEKLVLKTTGATLVLYARVQASPRRIKQE